MIPDAECLRVISEALTSLDLGPFMIRLNHRSLLDGIFTHCGVTKDKISGICTSLDKLDKVPWQEVRKEIIEVKQVDEAVIDKIDHYIFKQGREDLIQELREDENLMKEEKVDSSLKDIELLLQYCDIFNIKDNVTIDLTLARGLEYYTGPIFEAVLTGTISITGCEKRSLIFVLFSGEKVDVGSVAGGGRYDNLVNMFNDSMGNVPCVGASVGVERIFSILETKMANKGFEVRSSETEVFVATVHNNYHQERMKVLAELWDAKIKAEQFYKTNPSLMTQLHYCESNGIPLAVVLIEKDMRNNEVILRDVKTRKEKKISRDSLLEEVSNYLRTKSLM